MTVKRPIRGHYYVNAISTVEFESFVDYRLCSVHEISGLFRCAREPPKRRLQPRLAAPRLVQLFSGHYTSLGELTGTKSHLTISFVNPWQDYIRWMFVYLYELNAWYTSPTPAPQALA